MDRWLITFFLGSLLSLFLPTVPTLFYVVLLILFAVLAFSFVRIRKFSGFFFGAAWLLVHGVIYQETQQNSLLSPFLVGKQVAIEGEVTTIPQIKKDTQRFNFSISHINNEKLNSSILVRLSWKFSKPQLVKKISQGQTWKLNTRLKRAHGLANLGGFSYQTWLRKNNLVATGYVVQNKAKKSARKIIAKKLTENRLIENQLTIRQQLYQKINYLLPKENLSPLILALTFGERSQLTKEHWGILQNTATQHLIAISGLHLGLVAGGAFVLFNLLIKTLPLRHLLSSDFQLKVLQQNNQLIVIVFTLLVTLFYAYLADFSVPTLRALLMLMVYWFAKFLRIKLSVTRLFLLTLFLIILFLPFSLISTSFWLSFYAVSIIFILLWRYKLLFSNTKNETKTRFSQFKKWFGSLFYLQIGLIALMLPATVQINNQVSFLALPANLIAVPWMSFTTIPLSLLSVIFAPVNDAISSFFINCSLLSLKVIWQYLAWLSSFALADIAISFFEWLSLLTFSLLFILVFVVALPIRYVFIVCLFVSVIFLNYYHNLTSKKDTWSVNVMDVGQGLSVVVKLKPSGEKSTNKFLIYDTGASYPSGFSMAESVLLPYLKNQGVQVVDKVVISHNDNDHAGGLNLLTENFSIEQLIYNETPNNIHCIAGNVITWYQLTIEFLWPTSVLSDDNDDSCVIKISDGKNSVLLTGDISNKIEKQLITKYSSQLHADILIVPHHGSKTSSSLAFIKTVAPEYAIFSAGFLNRWKMPVKSVVERYQQLKVKTFNTAEQGMIKLEISPGNIHVKTYRKDIWPFWFAN